MASQADSKQGLVELIEAYAVAKASGNATLSMLATKALTQLLELVEMRSPQAPAVVVDDFVIPEPVAVSNGRRAKARVE